MDTDTKCDINDLGEALVERLLAAQKNGEGVNDRVVATLMVAASIEEFAAEFFEAKQELEQLVKCVDGIGEEVGRIAHNLAKIRNAIEEK